MSYCHHCDSLQEEDAVRCTQCGASLVETAPPPSTQTDPTASVSLEKSASAPPVTGELPKGDAGDNRTFTERYFALLMAGGIAGILAILALFLLLMLPPKEAEFETPIFQALEGTQAALMKEIGEASDELGLTPILNTFARKGITQELTLSIPIPGMGTGTLHALQGENAKGDRAYGLMDVDFMGLKFSLLEYSLEKDFLAFTSPALFSGVYGLSLDQFAQTFPTSELGRESGLSEEELTAVVEYYRALAQFRSNGNALSDETNAALRGALITLEGAMLCADPVEEIVIFDTGELSCQVHTAQIPLEALEAYLLDCADILLAEDVISAAIRFSFATEQRTDVDPIAEAKAQWEEQVRSLTDTLQTVELTAYLRDGIALRTDLFLRNKNDETMQFVAQWSGGEHLTDRFDLCLYVNESASMILYWDGTLLPQDGVLEGSLNIQFVDGAMVEGISETFWIVCSLRWDSMKTRDNLHFDVTLYDNASLSEAPSPQVTLDGSVALDNGILLDPLEFTYTDGKIGEQSATLSLHLTPTGELKSLAAHATDLLSLDNDELQALAEEIQSSLNRWFGFQL